MVKGMKRRSKENSEFKDKSAQMSESELKLMVEDLIKLISDNPKHKLFLNILNLFKNKEYSSLDFNEIYDYLLIDTKLNPLKYSSQDTNEETKPQLKSKLDLIMNKNCSFKVINRGRKKIIELNLLKTKEYLDKIINGEELLCNENELEEKKENNEDSEKMDKTEEEKIKEKKEEKELSLKEEEEEKKEEKDEPIKKHRGRKRKIKNENRENLNLVINLNQKKEDIEKKRKIKEKKEEKEIKLGKKQERDKDKEKEKEKEKEKNLRKSNRKKKEEDKDEKIEKTEKVEKKEKVEKVEKIENVEKKDKIDKMEAENNENFSIVQKKDDNIQANNIFLKPLFRELFENSSSQIKEPIQNEIESSLKQINNVKNDLGNLEDKMKLFNNKIIDLNINKQKYEDIKTKVKDTQDELYNLYFIMINEVNSLNILLKMKNYNKEIYNIHNEAIEKHKNEYANVVEKIKIYLINIKSLETEIITSKKEIKQLLNGIISLFKNMLGTINNYSSNYEKMELFELKYNEIETNENYIDINSIIRELLGKKDEVLKKLNGYNKHKEKKEEINNNDVIMQNTEKKNVINEEDIQKVYEEMARENEEKNKKECKDVIISQQEGNANTKDNTAQNTNANNN